MKTFYDIVMSSKFKEYAGDTDYEAVKRIVFDILDPQDNTIDDESTSILSRPLSDFKNRDDLLTFPNILDIINSRDNREAIVAAAKNPATTVGNFITLLTKEI